MRESSISPTTTAAMPSPPSADAGLTRGPPAAAGADPPKVGPLLAGGHDGIAAGPADIVVRRLFTAGLALEAVVGLMGDHRATRTVQEAISELDRAVRDLRDIVFDHHRPDLPAVGGRG